jgi:acetyl esterase
MQSRMVRRPRRLSKTALPIGAILLLAGCTVGTPFRDPTARANDDMIAVIQTYQKLGARPEHELTVQQARTQPTPDDAMRATVQAQTGRPFFASAFTRTTDLQVAGAAGPLAARLYDATPGHPGEPIILFFHGGTWVTGNLDTNDASDRALANMAHAMVLSVAYRLAPESPFPAAQDDAFASYRWLLQNAARLGADPRRIAIAGEAAGGNLAINTAIAARDAHLPPPVHELLIYPIVGTDVHTPSYVANQNAIPLGREDMRWSMAYLTGNNQAALADPRLDLIDHGDLHGLPRTTVISGEMDPLESEGKTVTQKLQASGVDVTYREYGGTTHAFFGMGAAVARAKEAETLAAAELDTTFDKIGAPPPPPRFVGRRGVRHPVRHHARPPQHQ